MKIDAHHHFWKYTTEEFGWIDDSMATIRRDFLPADLEAEIKSAGIDGVVSVQARQSVEETALLCQFAEEHDFILGVVGWLPLATKQWRATIEGLAEQRGLMGVRHVVQGEPDDFLYGSEFNAGIAELADYDLAYDILIFERQLKAAIDFVDRHPQQRFVLDHIAKPRIADNELEPWRTNLLELAKREHVTCKISGLATEADFQTWTLEQLQPYLDTVAEAFGPQRLMFGSDWPVCTVAVGYKSWFELVSQFAGQWSDTEQAAFFSGTARQAYQLD